MLRKLVILPALGFLTLVCSATAEPVPRFRAPNNEQELKARIEQLRAEYAPYLRSLPEKATARARTMLNGNEWNFTFETKDSPTGTILPPTPKWYTAEFDDSQWQITSVPEWRYRTWGNDNAYDTETVDQWTDYGGEHGTTNAICWYRTTFKGNRPPTGRRLWLCFDGVDWEAEVYLNGQLLGRHRVYYEPFRFDVTDKIQEKNTLAVRVIDGRVYGEPATYWSVFPDIRAEEQRYVPDRSKSIRGHLPIGYHIGTGFGIHRDVYLEQTGPVLVSEIFARNDLSDGSALVKVELDSEATRTVQLTAQLLPENFEGSSYEKTIVCKVAKGQGTQTLTVPMPEARVWSPDSPHLYRCRVTVRDGDQTVDGKDVLFGCRSFTLIHRKVVPPNQQKSDRQDDSSPDRDLPSGMFLLNDQPCYLRGTSIHGLNAYAYWGQTEQLLHTLLMLKAGNFNAVRSNQHVQFPEVREMLDRVGIMSEQDQGGGHTCTGKPEIESLPMGVRRPQHIHTGTVLTRKTYNNPGVVLLCFGNEHHFDTEPILRAALAVDPERIFKPISGRFSHSSEPLGLPEDLMANVIDDAHPYSGWYWTIHPQTWKHTQLREPQRMVTLGEFGAEALDAYKTMHDHYPDRFKPPAAETDTLWAAAQTQKHDLRQVVGLGRKPTNLAEYIEASQNYQEALLADKIIGMRLSPKAIGGYFQFHFIDVVPVHWPKSIVSHDHRPKKAYYQLAQLNQPIVALAHLTGHRPDAMTLWVANDLAEELPQCTIHWTVDDDGRTLLQGNQQIDVPAINVVKVSEINLTPITMKHPAFDLTLTLTNAKGVLISRYHRQVRCVPKQLLDQDIREEVEDTFNKKD